MFKLRVLRRLIGWLAFVAFGTMGVVSLLGAGPYPVSLTVQLFGGAEAESGPIKGDGHPEFEASQSAVEQDLERAIEAGVDRRILADELELDGRPPAGPAVDAGPFTLGDDEVLDGLWARCEAGRGEACDRLFDVSPTGSDYEWFGLSCGDRPGMIDCTTELDGTGTPD